MSIRMIMTMTHDHDHDHDHEVSIATRRRRHAHGHEHAHDHDHETAITSTTNRAATGIITTMRIAELTALLHLASPALPIGAFSYSQGLEAAIEAQLITDADSARDWIASGLTDVLARGELPFLAHQMERWRAHDADGLKRSKQRIPGKPRVRGTQTRNGTDGLVAATVVRIARMGRRRTAHDAWHRSSPWPNPRLSPSPLSLTTPPPTPPSPPTHSAGWKTRPPPH